ncbi:MAG: hypothetical protein DME18_05790 [Verrucomicrobia bacterium]|nr:MAG: hypothetical protein DME18_05790 [Verrucomicrobiota bacterium]
MRFKTFLLVSVLLFFATAAHAEFRAGVAIRVVTPDPLLPVSGGVGPSNKVSKKEGDLTVRALVLAEDNTAVAIVSADFLGFPSVLGNKARAKVKDIPPQNVLIGATHTHSAPDCYGFADHDGRVSTDLKYLDFVCNQIADAVNEANARLRPASLKIATAEVKGKIAFNAYAEQLYDPRCHVIQAIGADGRPFATLVNYAVHPEVLGPDAGILSPDLVGPLYQRIHEKGGGTGIFMNSAQGGMVTADNRGPDGKSIRAWPECERIGNLLADEALRIVASAPEQKTPKLFCAARSITFPVDSPLLRAVMMSSPLHYAGNDTNRVTTQLNLVNVGNAQILTIPGEALPNIGYYLKRKMRGEHNLLFGLTNDAFGYILTKVDWNSFKRYDYVSRTSLGEMTGEIYMDEALKLVQESLASERLAP